jgi:hypothetical protein
MNDVSCKNTFEYQKRKSPSYHLLGLLLMVLFLGFSLIASTITAHGAVGNLEIRVGYFGDVNDYRLKSSMTHDQIDQLSDQIYYYQNVTNVGTVMGTVAQGVPITELLEQAGIDPNSVQTVNFRTTDGTQVNNWFVSLSMEKWVTQSRYYYPALRSNYDNTTGSVIPLDGALVGKDVVPSILAIRSFSTKSPSASLDPVLMTEDDSYRFCVGQGDIAIGEPVAEITSMNSAKWITGIDVTLWGSPSDAASLEISITDPNIKVGTSTQVASTVKGQDLFEDKLNGEVTWSSSDPSIATVDENGLVTILKAGKVTITATTDNGLSKSIVLNGVAPDQPPPDPGNGGDDNGNTNGGNGTVDNGQETIDHGKVDEGNTVINPPDLNGTGTLMREITLATGAKAGNGVTVTPLPEERRNPNALGAATGFAALCLVIGIAWRITGYRKEV